MGFTIGVSNAPATAVTWVARCNIGSGPNMDDAISLSSRWSYAGAAPGPNWMDIACFDSTTAIVKESRAYVNIVDGKNYTFDFNTETLSETSVSILGSGILELMITMMMVVMMIKVISGMIKK